MRGVAAGRRLLQLVGEGVAGEVGCSGRRGVIASQQAGRDCVSQLQQAGASTRSFARRAAASPEDERAAALAAALAQIEKAYGKGTVMRLGEHKAFEPVPAISTGSIALDAALGIGGLPRGRVTEIYGPEASGKTTIALHAVAEAQKQGGTCLFVDVEHALDQNYARALGVNTDELLVSQPDSGEQALDVVDKILRSNSVDAVVVDSVAALVPRAELEGEMGDAHMALQARLMSQALRKLTHSISTSQAACIFLNQIRSKLSTFSGFGGPTEVTAGGNALKFYATVRLDIRRIASLKTNDKVTGNTVRVKVAKNKLAPPFRQVQFDIEFGRGISQDGELLDIALQEGIITKSGAWYAHEGTNFAQGREKGKQYLQATSDFRSTLMTAVKERLRSSALNSPPESMFDEDEEPPSAVG
eukprot:jgi/Chlat1/7995/Chrsp7S07753